LHAGASQALAALSMTLGRLAKVATCIEELELIHAGHVMIEQVTREIRTISYLLHPPLLEELGLAFALRAYAQGFSERCGIPVRVENDALLEQLPDDSEIAVFRVVQESLSNIHRHSGATEAAIRVAESAGGLQLTISDNGRGVSEEKQRELAESVRAGVGILGMRERIHQLGGTLEIVSGANGNEKALPSPANGTAPANGKTATRTAALVTRATKPDDLSSNESLSGGPARSRVKPVGPGTRVSVTVPLPRAAHA